MIGGQKGMKKERLSLFFYCQNSAKTTAFFVGNDTFLFSFVYGILY